MAVDTVHTFPVEEVAQARGPVCWTQVVARLHLKLDLLQVHHISAVASAQTVSLGTGQVEGSGSRHTFEQSSCGVVARGGAWQPRGSGRGREIHKVRHVELPSIANHHLAGKGAGRWGSNVNKHFRIAGDVAVTVHAQPRAAQGRFDSREVELHRPTPIDLSNTAAEARVPIGTTGSRREPNLVSPQDCLSRHDVQGLVRRRKHRIFRYAVLLVDIQNVDSTICQLQNIGTRPTAETQVEVARAGFNISKVKHASLAGYK
mmetsp:Transcript_13979/g.27068  ORF Transcript_13979/g.27068 Transcript_13979/m.27068 type:complete len:260 (+) Transcript_13979:1382-2161(+)